MSDFEQCCNPGTVWQGTPTGKEIKVGGLDAYVATPSSGSAKAGILVLNDIWGWEIKNTRLFTDRLAKAGFLAVCPDFFHGQAPTKDKAADPSFLPNFLKGYPDQQVLGECTAVMDEMRSKHGVSSIGTIGFCWGGWYAALLNASQSVEASVINHVSFLVYHREVVDQLKKPVLFQCSDNDKMMPDEFRFEVEQKLSKLPIAQKTMVKFYPGQAHGWTLRGDDKDPSVSWSAEDAYRAAVYFFQVFVPGAPSL